VAGLLLAALALAGGALAAEGALATAEECALLKKRACRKSPYCRWGGRGDRAASGARCAVAANVCDTVQRGRKMRYRCTTQALRVPPAVPRQAPADTCGCSRKKGKRCGACTVTTPTDEGIPTPPTDEGIPTPPTDEGFPTPFPTCIGSRQCDGDKCYFDMTGAIGGRECGFLGSCLARYIGGDIGQEFCDKSFPHPKWIEKCIEFGKLDASEQIAAAVCAGTSPPLPGPPAVPIFPFGNPGAPGCCLISAKTGGTKATGHLLCDCLKELVLILPGESAGFPIDFIWCLLQGGICCADLGPDACKAL